MDGHEEICCDIQNQQSISLRFLFTLLSHCSSGAGDWSHWLGQVVVALVRGIFIESSIGFGISRSFDLTPLGGASSTDNSPAVLESSIR